MLNSARAVVIDDNPEEAMPIIRALSQLRVGAIYIPGDRVEDLPPVGSPIKGLRLAFVDMKLNIEGTARQVVSKTVSVLKRVVAPTTSPFVIVLWTKHSNYAEEFENAVKEELASCG